MKVCLKVGFINKFIILNKCLIMTWCLKKVEILTERHQITTVCFYFTAVKEYVCELVSHHCD